jgi:phosphatidylethanolamine/phosphatidyl-N-methylethanolamine N-methyltransferase
MANDQVSAAHESHLYSTFSRLYDLLFTSICLPRLRCAISKMDIRPGDRVLDVGVGTGLSLGLYPRHCQVVGIDLSDDMLKVAEKRRRRQKLDHVTLRRMDATKLDFPDDHFDHILAAFLISVVDDPQEVVRGMSRVGKPGCGIVVINHFRNDLHMWGQLEDLLSPLCRRLGWRSDMRFEEAFNNGSVRIDERRKWRHLDLWDIVVATNTK